VREALEALVRMLAPFAPHMAEEMWESLGCTGGLAATSWPAFDPEVAKAEEIEIPVQINGKVRSHLTVAPISLKRISRRRRWPTRRSRRILQARR
jgi:leucyl-tRNA synthetase